jgi:hypothetical protein
VRLVGIKVREQPAEPDDEIRSPGIHSNDLVMNVMAQTDNNRKL